MISEISQNITEKLCSQDIISYEEEDLYSYGFFLLLSRCVYFSIAGILGCLFGIFLKSMLFAKLFLTLRNYAGGVHASKEKTCMISTTILLFVSIFSIYILQLWNGISIALLLLVLGGIIIFLMGPLGSEEKPLTQEEVRLYGTKSRWLTGVLIASTLLLCTVEVYGLLYIASMAIFMEGILLILEKLKIKNRGR